MAAPDWGPETVNALGQFADAAAAGQVVVQSTAGRILKGDCPWTAQIDGDDIVVRNVTATCFGGAHDAGDDGQTESGAINDGSNPNLMGVALPIRSTEAATKGSPLALSGPHIPWFSKVLVWSEADGEGTAIECELVDNGPEVSRYPAHAIDLNPNVVLKHFAPDFDPLKVANEWGASGISYRIKGAAKYAL